ncbi:MAG: DNA-binding protein [Candidatus Thiodiazotropha sp.]
MSSVNETKTNALKTADQVVLAAHELLRQGQGQAITQRKIYEAIGNRGSMKTIQQALAEFWADLGTHLQQLEYLQGFPPEALTPLLEAFTGIRAQAEAQARSNYEAETQAARTAIEKADSERSVALEALDAAKTEIQTLKHQVEQLVEKRDSLQQQLLSETDRRQALEAQIPTLREEARLRLDQAKSETQGIRNTLLKEEERHQATEVRLTTLYDQERTARAQERSEAEKTQQTLQRKLDDLNQTFLETKQAGVEIASQLSQEVARRSGQIEQLEARQQQLQNQLNTEQAERGELAATLATEQADRRHGQQRIEALEQVCAKLETECQQKSKVIQKLNRQIAKQSKKEK